MKVTRVRITLDPEQAKIAGGIRLADVADDGVTSFEEAQNYRGPEFIEGPGCADLHVVYREGFVCVNFVDETGYRINYDYPRHVTRRVHYASTKLSESKQLCLPVE